MPRELYAASFGPTVGDKIRLGDTGLFIEVEKDLGIYGDECMFGSGKVQCDSKTPSFSNMIDATPGHQSTHIVFSSDAHSEPKTMKRCATWHSAPGESLAVA